MSETAPVPHGEREPSRPLYEPAAYVQHLRTDVKEVLADVLVHVFVMGPAPDAGSPASTLRRELITRCRDYPGYSALMEHGEIIDAVRDEAGDGADLAFVEEVHANRVDVLVFIPSSVGSIAELGFFAGLARGRRQKGIDLIQKSIVILDSSIVKPATEEWKGKRGFMADGPVAMMEALNAKVLLADYEDIDGVWRTVQERIEAIRRFKSKG